MYKLIEVNSCGNCKNYAYDSNFGMNICKNPPEGISEIEANFGKICGKHCKKNCVKPEEALGSLIYEFREIILRKEIVFKKDGKNIFHKYNSSYDFISVYDSDDMDNVYEYDIDYFDDILICLWETLMDESVDNPRYIDEDKARIFSDKLNKWLNDYR